MIELDDVHKTLGGKEVLRGMTFRVPNGCNYVIMGPSGVGKSVTLRHVIGIMKPDAGTVRVDGLEVPGLDRRGLAELRKRMGYLFQNGALINWLTVFENVALPLREHLRLPEPEIRRRVCEVLELVDMQDAAGQYPPQISGGMRLRAGLARALVTEPHYVLYDEPNAGLDPIRSDQIHRLIVRVRDDLGVTGLVVTHSRACALMVADRIGIMDEGRIVEEGTVAEMLESSHPMAQAFLQATAD